MPEAVRGKALVVEDEALVAMALADFLESLGLVVVGPAPNVAMGLALLDQHPDIAVAVLDVNLKGDRSWPVAERAVALGVPIVFLTGYTRHHAMIPPELAHAAVCCKPLEEDDLRRCIVSAMAARAE